LLAAETLASRTISRKRGVMISASSQTDANSGGRQAQKKSMVNWKLLRMSLFSRFLTAKAVPEVLAQSSRGEEGNSELQGNWMREAVLKQPKKV